MCCGNNTVTDKDGRCCAAGHLDACGVCNGDGIVTDLYVAMHTGAVNASHLPFTRPSFFFSYKLVAFRKLPQEHKASLSFKS